MPVDYTPIAARRRKPSNLGQPIADSDQMHPTGPAAMRANAGDFLERHIDQAARLQPVLLELDVFRHGKESIEQYWRARRGAIQMGPVRGRRRLHLVQASEPLRLFPQRVSDHGAWHLRSYRLRELNQL